MTLAYLTQPLLETSQPSQLSKQEGLVITPSFHTVVDNFNGHRLDAATERSLGRIKNQTGLSIPTSPGTDATSAGVVVSVDGPGETIQSAEEDESYSLEITPASAHLRAATVVGAMHGLGPLEQLIQSDAAGPFIPAVSIHDTPRFPLACTGDRLRTPRCLPGNLPPRQPAFASTASLRVAKEDFRLLVCTEWLEILDMIAEPAPRIGTQAAAEASTQ